MTRKKVESFEELQTDFYHYSMEFGGIMPRTSKNYLAWLKFLSDYYKIDRDINDEYIEHILSQEEIARESRSFYSKKKDITNFHSALRAFKNFVESDYHKRYEDSILHEIDKIKSDSQIQITEKESIIKSRIGQGSFRKDLITYWRGCAVSGCGFMRVLMASHIKPWRDADNSERLDVFNGLLLLPNYDKLFDLGYITFNSRGKMVCSKLLSPSERKIIGIEDAMKLIRIDDRHKPYLKYHNERCFLG